MQARSAAKQLHSAAPVAAIAGSATTIAVIDDDESVRWALGELLRAASFRPVVFASAEEFLESPAAKSVDCLIVDVNLPGMSGVALLGALRVAGSRLPAILISARDDLATRELIRASGLVPCLRKPFGDEELFSAISRALHG